MDSAKNCSLHQSRKVFFEGVEASTTGMMQTENAEALAEIDTTEILAYLPDFHNKRVLDLGAGVGRFTSKLAAFANHVTAVDISQRFINQNKNTNKNFQNITYICNDVTEVDFAPGSFDLVFSSWILKYLSDDEIFQLASRALKWLTPGGYFFFRESCFHQLGTISKDGNPTIFRPISKYCELLHSASLNNVKFKLKKAKNVQSFLQFQGAPNQVCFLANRIEEDSQNDLSKLWQTLHSLENITKLEKAFGSPWITVGGKHTAKAMCGRLELHPSQVVLDIGCGTGTSSFMMAKEFGVFVHGIDFSIPAINLAIERQLKLDVDLRRRVQFEAGNVLEMDFEDGIYDVIYSRECFLYIPNKILLFKTLFKWLRPGGILFFTDFLKGSSPPSESLLEYLETIKHTMDSYIQATKLTGFKNLTSDDNGEQWAKILEDNLKIFASTSGESLGDEMNHAQMRDFWLKKIEWVNGKQLTWGVFKAYK